METRSPFRKRKQRTSEVEQWTPEVDTEKLVQQIASASCKEEIMVYLSHSYSIRSLELTWEAIKLNPDNELVWRTRRDILIKGHYSELHKEYDCIASLPIASEVDHSPIWQHRLWIAEKLGVNSMRKEFEFTIDNLARNPLHQSAWLNMEQLSQKFGKEFLHKELLLTTNILSTDQENKYAWNHRSLLTNRLEASAAHLEVELTKERLSKNSKDQNAWSYMMNLAWKLRDDIIGEALKFVDTILLADGKNTRAWFYRRRLADIGTLTGTAILSHELEFTEVLLSKDPQNKYAWSYRRWVFEKTGINGSKNELSFTAMILSKDSKNDFAWCHRQWYLEKFGWLEGFVGWLEELAYCDKCLEGDIYHESAWNQRSFVMRRDHLGMKRSSRSREVEYAGTVIREDPENGFAWMYLRSLYVTSGSHDKRLESVFEFVLGEISGVIDHGYDMKNTRIYVNTLETLRYVMNCGYKPSERLVAAFAHLCSGDKLGSCALKAISRLSNDIYSALQDRHRLNV